MTRYGHSLEAKHTTYWLIKTHQQAGSCSFAAFAFAFAHQLQHQLIRRLHPLTRRKRLRRVGDRSIRLTTYHCCVLWHRTQLLGSIATHRSSHSLGCILWHRTQLLGIVATRRSSPSLSPGALKNDHGFLPMNDPQLRRYRYHAAAFFFADNNRLRGGRSTRRRGFATSSIPKLTNVKLAQTTAIHIPAGTN